MVFDNIVVLNFKIMYTLSDFNVLNLVEEAVAYGVSALNGVQNAMALQIGDFWLDGWIEGRKENLTEDDIKSIKATMKNYFFI